MIKHRVANEFASFSVSCRVLSRPLSDSMSRIGAKAVTTHAAKFNVAGVSDAADSNKPGLAVW